MLYQKLKISAKVLRKLIEKHRVSRNEVRECFYNRKRDFLEDTRSEHLTEPPTLWFIARANNGRLLKVVFIKHNDGTFEIKTAYEPNLNEVKIYEKYA